MSEKGQPLPYRLGACAGCCDLEQQLAQMTQERDKWNENHRVMCRVEHELRQQLVQAQAARTICDVHQAEFDRLEEQLAQQLQQLGAITLALKDAGCPLDESGSDFVIRQAQQLATLLSMSTVEMMGENLNVKHHVEEWEARCLKAEQQLVQAQAEIAQLKTLYEADMGRTLPEVER